MGSGNAQPVSRMESFGWRLRESANFSQLAADIWLPAHSNHVQQQKSDMRTLDTESCNIDESVVASSDTARTYRVARSGPESN